MAHKSEITNETIREIVAQGQQYCIRILKAGTVRNQLPAEAEQIQIEHLRYLFQLKAERKLLINGPVIDDPEIKGAFTNSGRCVLDTNKIYNNR